ncbi:MAG: hypothetical protein HeimC3_52410 [Candidatus Heimdallarchaeota archaeon LC_3]|nr:MAG: hypothetical protein HeimC3_52410 [Candidatus Heimdallarchaeota archaeon LC_3]
MISNKAISELNEIIRSNKMYRELLEYLKINPQIQSRKGLFVVDHLEPSPEFVIIDIFNKNEMKKFNEELSKEFKIDSGEYKDRAFSLEQIHNLRTNILLYYDKEGFKELKPTEDNKIQLLRKNN